MNEPLQNQPTSAPTLKMQASGAAGALVTVIVFAAGLAHVQIDATTAAALVFLISFAAGYLKRNRA